MGVALTSCLKHERGQMTVEMAVVFPVLIIVAVIAVNALVFVSECAAFDRVFGEAVRVHAASRAYGQSEATAVGEVRAALERAFSEDNIAIDVTVENAGSGCRRFIATLQYAPTLFGLGLRESVLGVSLPRVSHSASFVIDSYKPGVFL